MEMTEEGLFNNAERRQKFVMDIPPQSAMQTALARRRRQTPLSSSRTSPLTGESPPRSL